MIHSSAPTCLHLVIIAIICCAGCYGEVCSSDFCKVNEYCIMKSSTCANKTCPKVASCISNEHVCSTSFPYLDRNEAVMQCSESSRECPVGYKCQSRYCCVDLDQPSIDGDFESIGDESNVEDGGRMIDNIFGPLDVDSDHDCKPCGIKRCDFEVCNYPEPVKCVADNCSCTITYEDLNGRPVQCEIPVEGQITGLPGLPNDVAFPAYPAGALPDDSTEVLDHTEILNDDVTDAEEVLMITTAKKSIILLSTQKEIVTLQSSDNGKEMNKNVIFVVGALGTSIILAIIGYAAYKFYTARVVKQNQNQEKDINEVKVPFKDMSSHNNNEVKVTENLLNGEGP